MMNKNKRNAALDFIRQNSKCLRAHEWARGPAGTTIIEYRVANGKAFFLMDMLEDGWSCFFPTEKNNVDTEMEKFAEYTGEKFVHNKNDNDEKEKE